MADKSPSRAKRTPRPSTPTTPEAVAPAASSSPAPETGVKPMATAKPRTRAQAATPAPVEAVPSAPAPAAAPTSKAKAPSKAGTKAGAAAVASAPAKPAAGRATPGAKKGPATKAAAAKATAGKQPAARPKAPGKDQPPTPATRTEAAAGAVQAPGSRPLSVLIVASEALPFARTGALADVVGGLPGALAAQGHRVTLVVPKYAGTSAPAAAVDRFLVTFGDHAEEATCYEVPLGPNARAVLVEHAGFFEREFLYARGQEDYADNPRRFAFLSQAALEFSAREGERVDVVHAHDWQTGLVPVYLRTQYSASPALAGAASVFTVHNAAFQGLCPPEWLGMLGLGHDLFSVGGLEYWGRLSLLKGGINFADVVTAAGDEGTDLLDPERGCGFEGILAARGDAFRGVPARGAGAPGAEYAAVYADAVRLKAGQESSVAAG